MSHESSNHCRHSILVHLGCSRYRLRVTPHALRSPIPQSAIRAPHFRLIPQSAIRAPHFRLIPQSAIRNPQLPPLPIPQSAIRNPQLTSHRPSLREESTRSHCPKTGPAAKTCIARLSKTPSARAGAAKIATPACTTCTTCRPCAWAASTATAAMRPVRRKKARMCGRDFRRPGRIPATRSARIRCSITKRQNSSAL